MIFCVISLLHKKFVQSLRFSQKIHFSLKLLKNSWVRYNKKPPQLTSNLDHPCPSHNSDYQGGLFSKLVWLNFSTRVRKNSAWSARSKFFDIRIRIINFKDTFVNIWGDCKSNQTGICGLSVMQKGPNAIHKSAKVRLEWKTEIFTLIWYELQNAENSQICQISWCHTTQYRASSPLSNIVGSWKFTDISDGIFYMKYQ